MIRILVLLYCLQSAFLENSNNVEISETEALFSESTCIEEPTQDFWTQHLLMSTDNVIGSLDVEIQRSYKSEVNRLVQYYDIEHSYTVINEEGPSHNRIFNISLSLGDETYYGIGKSKKEAKEMAAKKAIQTTSYDRPPDNLKDPENKNAPPTVLLNNFGAKHGYQIDYFILDPKLSNRILNLKLIKEKSQFTNTSFWKEAAHLDEPPKSPFHVEVNVEGNSFYGKGHTIQSAKHDAASKAVETLKELGMDKSSPCTQENKAECKKAKSQLKSPISLVYEFSQKNRMNVEFNELSKTGPSHKPIFEFECILGSHSTKAEGKSKKEAKKNAAEKMLARLPEIESTQYSTSGEIAEKSTKKRESSHFSFDTIKNSVKNAINIFDFKEDIDQNELHNSESDDSNKASKKSQQKQKNRDRNHWSPKERLLNAAKTLNLQIQFSSEPTKTTGYHTLLNLDLNPKYICIGKGANVHISQEYAALNALKFLHKLDLLEHIEEDDLKVEKFSFDNFIWLTADTSPKR